VIDRSSFGCVGSVFHARGAPIEKALSPIRRRVYCIGGIDSRVLEPSE